MIVSLEIALKFHRSSKKNHLISLVSVISVIGVSIGIAVAIISFSIINGFENELSERFLSILPHAEIVSVKHPFVDWEKIITELKHISDIVEISPYINFSGIIEHNNKWHFLNIRTINLKKNYSSLNKEMKLTSFIERKSWDFFCQNKNQIILGRGASNVLNLKTGDWITIFFVQNSSIEKNKFSSLKKIKIQVAGILDLHSQLDANFGMISFSAAQTYCNRTYDADGIEITVKDIFKVDQIIRKIKKNLNNNIIIKSWIDTYGHVYQDIQIVRLIIYLTVIFLLGISCFSIITTLTLAIKDKCYDIAILKSIGCSNILIQHIFLWYGLIIYGISSIIGVIVGLLVVLNLKNLDVLYTNFFGNSILPKNIYFIDFIPVYFDVWNVFYILSITLFIGLIVSWGVSYRIKKMKLIKKLK